MTLDLHCFFCDASVAVARINNGGLACCERCEARLRAPDPLLAELKFVPCEGAYRFEVSVPMPSVR